ncbi:MAG TPA: ABC transporter permease [Acidimicrobiia bacterium]|nr:ABC transporter permease [Acidimicrobiia bacterium]
MTGALRAEWLKLRTARLPWGLLAVALALAGVHAVLFDSNAGGTGHTSIESLATYTGQRQAITMPVEVLLFVTVLGVIVASGEFRHGTATNTYLSIPNRIRVLAAKSIAAGTVGALFGLAGAGLTTAIGLSFIVGGGHDVLLSAATIARYAVGATIAAGALAAAGVGLGSLVRSQVAATIAVFVWGLVIEQTIGGLYETAQRYLPYTAAASLAGAKLEAGTTALPFLAAVTLIASAAMAISFVAARTTVTADVT